MSRRPPREARFLGLWTAGCLTVLLLVGLLVAGDITLQWPVFVVPVLWALVALRPRRGARGRRRDGPAQVGRAARPDDDEPGFWDYEPGSGLSRERGSGDRALPPTRETRVLPPLPPGAEDHRRG